MTKPELITTRFTATSTAADVLRGVDLTGLRAIVTGGSSGLGVETARALTAAGAAVTLAVRNSASGEAVADAIGTTTGAIRPRVRWLDLAYPGSINAFTEAWEGPVHLLINNAGLVTSGLERTADGWELQFATNHLGHFALACGLHDALAAGAAERNGARVVNLSSTAHMRAGIDFDDIHFDRRSYDPPDRLVPIQDRELTVRRRRHASLGFRRDRGEQRESRRRRHRASTQLQS